MFPYSIEYPSPVDFHVKVEVPRKLGAVFKENHASDGPSIKKNRHLSIILVKQNNNSFGTTNFIEGKIKTPCLGRVSSNAA